MLELRQGPAASSVPGLMWDPHAGTDSEGFLDLVHLTLLFLFVGSPPALWGSLSGPVTCNYQTVRQVRAAEMLET